MANKRNDHFDDFANRIGDAGSIYASFLEFDACKSDMNVKEVERRGWKKSGGEETFHKYFSEFQNSGRTLLRSSLGAERLKRLAWLQRIRDLANAFFAFGDIPEFSGLSKDELKSIAGLSVDVESVGCVADRLLQLGVILIYERSLPGMKVDGACFRLPSGHPIIALSLRFSRLDNFWFTLLHELAHVCLHYDDLDDPFIDDIENIGGELEERQADRLALNSFIDRNIWRNAQPRYTRELSDVYKFAEQQGVHPVVVAGRLRRELGRHDMFSELINQVDTRRILLNE